MHPNKLIKKLTLITIIFMVVVLCIACFFEHWIIVVKSSVFATAISLLGLQLIALSTVNLHKSRWTSYTEYIIRMFLYAFAIVIAFKLKMNIILVVIGLMSTKVAIIFYGLYYRGGIDGHK